MRPARDGCLDPEDGGYLDVKDLDVKNLDTEVSAGQDHRSRRGSGRIDESLDTRLEGGCCRIDPRWPRPLRFRTDEPGDSETNT
jgi:hypothetical protein